MSQENVEIVREANEAWKRGDLDAVVRALDPRIEWHTAADEPDAGPHRGVEAIIFLIADWAQSLRTSPSSRWSSSMPVTASSCP